MKQDSTERIEPKINESKNKKTEVGCEQDFIEDQVQCEGLQIEAVEIQRFKYLGFFKGDKWRLTMRLDRKLQVFGTGIQSSIFGQVFDNDKWGREDVITTNL